MNFSNEKKQNGVSLDKLAGTIDAVKANPSLARFNFRARNHWVGGACSKTTIQGFFGAGQEDASRRIPFELVGDEPTVLLGTDLGPNAVETVLHALASCLVVGFVYNAAARGISLDSLEMEMEGQLDLRGFLGLSETVRPGYEKIRVTCRVGTQATEKELEDLWQLSLHISPVLDIVRNPVAVEFEMKKVF